MVVSIKKYNKNINKKCTKTKKMFGGSGPGAGAGGADGPIYSEIYSGHQSSNASNGIYSEPYIDGPKTPHVYSTVNINSSNTYSHLTSSNGQNPVGSNIYNTLKSSGILKTFVSFFNNNNLAEKFVAMENEYLRDEFIFNEEFMGNNILVESNKISFNDFKNKFDEDKEFIDKLKTKLTQNNIYNQQNTEKFIKLNEKYFIINYLLDSNKTNNNDSNFSKIPRRLARILKCKIDNDNNDDLKTFINTKFSDDNDYNNNNINTYLEKMDEKEIKESIQSAFTEYTTYTS